MFKKRYADVYHGDDRWRAIDITGSATYAWPASSTYIQNPPYFTGMTMTATPPGDIVNARALAVFGDSITTDHISPAGAIKPDSPAGRYLLENGVSRAEFNSYGARRGNHEVMMRGTFANIRIRNRMLDNVEGGYTRYAPTGETLPIYDAAMAYKHDETPLVIIAGKEYGTGSSRDWAAKGTVLLGVRTVIAESFERIHRSNLVGMGVLPLQFRDGENAESLGINGTESFSISGVADIQPRQDVEVQVTRADGSTFTVTARCRIDTFNELEYFRSAESYTTYFGASRRNDGGGAGRHVPLRAGADHAARTASRGHPVQLQPVQQDRLSGHLLPSRGGDDRRRVRRLCPGGFEPGVPCEPPLQGLRHPDSLDAASRAAA